jgi:hypothetical protein
MHTTPILNKTKDKKQIDVTLKDILLNSLLGNNEYGSTPDCSSVKKIDSTFVFDKTESEGVISLKLYINNEPATNITNNFIMYLIPADNNDIGEDEFEVNGEVVDNGDSIIKFTVNLNNNRCFSLRKNKMQKAKYLVYAKINDKRKLLMLEGDIILVDRIEEYVEGK